MTDKPRETEEPSRREIAREVLIYALIVLAFGAAFAVIQARYNDRNVLSFDPHGSHRAPPAERR